MNRLPIEVINILSDRKTRSEVVCKNSIESLYRKHPDLEEIERSLRVAKADKLIAIINGKNPEGINEQINMYEHSRQEYLKKYGISSQYDVPRPYCTECGDEGYYNGDLCLCVRELLAPILLEKSGLDRYPEMSFEQHRAELFLPQSKIHAIYGAVKSMSKFSIDHIQNLLFWGPPGTGKTFLAVSFAKAIVNNGYSVRIIRASELIDLMGEYKTIKRSFSPAPERVRAVHSERNFILQCDLLVIDELGVEPKGLNDAAELLQILGDRLVPHKKTLITTNLSPSEMAKEYDNRLYSRLIGAFEIFGFEGKDLRINSKFK